MTTGVTKNWVAQQAAKASAPVVEGWKDGALTIFVEGRPRHFKGSMHVTAKLGHTQRLRERTATRILMAVPSITRVPLWGSPALPKHVHFTVYWRSAFDGDDNLRLVCSAAKDALMDMKIIDDDADARGHRFTYEQTVSRKAGSVHGIAVKVELLT